MRASPQGLYALTAGGVEWPIIGAQVQDINTVLGVTCAGLRWKRGDLLAFAHNTDAIRTVQYNLVTGEYDILYEGGFNDLYAGGDVVALFNDLGYWDSTGNDRSGNQRAIAVDDASGSIGFMREDRSGIDAYVGSNRIRIFDGYGNYGGCFRQRVLHFITPDKRMYRWELDNNTVMYLFTLPPWMRPIAQYSGGWFLSWHDNIGGVVIWNESDLEHGRIITQGIEANDPQIIRLGDEVHVLYASGAGELLNEGVRRIVLLNDLNAWPLANLLKPDVPVPTPVEVDMQLPEILASRLTLPSHTYPNRKFYQGEDGRWLGVDDMGNVYWVPESMDPDTTPDTTFERHGAVYVAPRNFLFFRGSVNEKG